MVKDYQKIGSLGGKVSPTNFKNNPKLASKAGKIGRVPKQWPQCPVCGAKMSQQKLETHITTHDT